MFELSKDNFKSGHGHLFRLNVALVIDDIRCSNNLLFVAILVWGEQLLCEITTNSPGIHNNTICVNIPYLCLDKDDIICFRKEAF